MKRIIFKAKCHKIEQVRFPIGSDFVKFTLKLEEGEEHKFLEFYEVDDPYEYFFLAKKSDLNKEKLEQIIKGEIFECLGYEPLRTNEDFDEDMSPIRAPSIWLHCVSVVDQLSVDMYEASLCTIYGEF